MSLERRVRSPSPSLFMPRPTAMTIFVFANKCRRARKFELTKFDLLAYNPTLDFIARMIGMRTEGGIKALYLLNGKKVNGSRELENGGAYVGVSGHERFRRMEYNDQACVAFNRELKAANEKKKGRGKERGLPRIGPKHKHNPAVQLNLDQFYGCGTVLESSKDFRKNYRRITGNKIETPSSSGLHSLAPTASLPCLANPDPAHTHIANPDVCRDIHSHSKQRHLSANSNRRHSPSPNPAEPQPRSFCLDSPKKCKERHISPTGRMTPNPPPRFYRDAFVKQEHGASEASPVRRLDTSEDDIEQRYKKDITFYKEVQSPRKERKPSPDGDRTSSLSFERNRNVERNHSDRRVSPSGRQVAIPTSEKNHEAYYSKDVTCYTEGQPQRKARSPSPHVKYKSSLLFEKDRGSTNVNQSYRESRRVSPRIHSLTFNQTETNIYDKNREEICYNVGVPSNQERYMSPDRRQSRTQLYEHNRTKSYHATKEESFYENVSLESKHRRRNLSSRSSRKCSSKVMFANDANGKARSYNNVSSSMVCRDHDYNSDMLLYGGKRPERKLPKGQRKRSRSAVIQRDGFDERRNRIALRRHEARPASVESVHIPSPRLSRSPYVTAPPLESKRQHRRSYVETETRGTLQSKRQHKQATSRVEHKPCPSIPLPRDTIPFYRNAPSNHKELSAPPKPKPVTPDPLRVKQALHHAKGVPYYAAIYSARQTKKLAARERPKFETSPLPASGRTKTKTCVRKSFYDERVSTTTKVDATDTLESQFRVLEMKREEYVPWSADTEVPMETSQTMIEMPHGDDDDYYSLRYKGDQGDLPGGKKEKRKKGKG